ncbi:MAG TPA: alanine dehydrogenase, partial [Firmicutes bacterium]|nr:alanine dehydrogenase [Bacillota bacterium]
MVVGVPREIKKDENRVGITPAGAMALAGKGHQVIVETGAGEGSGFTDEEFRAAGAETVTREELFARADMILKVKEPLSEEYDYFRPGQVLFAYLHLAADRKLTQALVQREVV